MKQPRLRLKLFTTALLAIAIIIPTGLSASASRTNSSTSGPGNPGQNPYGLVRDPGFTACTLYRSAEGVACRTAGPGEQAMTTERDLGERLEVISPVGLHAETGLKIVLRATSQLNSFPAAKDAFLKVAARWQSLIQTPITVVVDVDFGSTWFGNPYPDGVLGQTSPQLLQAPGIYHSFKLAMVDGASSVSEEQMYLNLPNNACPTDLGDTSLVYAPSAVYRAVGFIDPDPVNDPAGFGPSPAVGFNSHFAYDFDPNDGIDPGKVDFDAVVAHELGHVLGFVSAAAQTEMDPSRTLGVTVWDLFRFRPGVNMSSFTESQRVMSSGGFQIFFNGGDDDVQLSTGRPDQTGGDGRQASHWKDDDLSGLRIGIMDPSLPAGKRAAITVNDLGAIDSFGYKLAPFGDNAPSIKQLSADLDGDVLNLSGKMSDLDGDVVQAQIQLLDKKGVLLGTSSPFGVDIGVTETFFFNLHFNGVSGSPLAMKAALVFIDTRGNRSASVDADFSGADGGGPKLKTATFNDDLLKVKGKKMNAPLQFEINGQVLPPSIVIGGSAKKLTMRGDTTTLNLRPGPNRLRVISNGLRSNLLVLSL